LAKPTLSTLGIEGEEGLLIRSARIADDIPSEKFQEE